jgi:hypothetical protein
VSLTQFDYAVALSLPPSLKYTVAARGILLKPKFAGEPILGEVAVLKSVINIFPKKEIRNLLIFAGLRGFAVLKLLH